MITYQIERLADCVFEIKAHAPSHWDEVASHKDVRSLNVNWDVYLQMERAGRLIVATARLQHAHRRLVGYVAMYCCADPHSRETLGAESAFYYVERRPVRGLVQRNLIRFMCCHLREKGVQYVKFRNKLMHSNAPILANLGFRPDEMIYTLKLT